jgi:hypothetical protein
MQLNLHGPEGYNLYKRSLELEREHISKHIISDLFSFMMAWSISGLLLYAALPSQTTFVGLFLSLTLIIALSHTYYILDKGHTHYKTHQYYLNQYKKNQ